MKVLAILCVAIFAGVALAQDEVTIAPFKCDGNVLLCKLKELAHHASFHVSKLGNSLKDVGSSILTAALDQGTNLLAVGSQALLGTVVEHLSSHGLGHFISGFGKREISFLSKIKEHFSTGVEFMKNLRDSLKAKFETAVNKLTSTMEDTTTVNEIEDDASSKIDAVVAQFKEAGKEGFFKMAATISQKIREIWAEAMTEAKAKMGLTTDKRALIDLFNSAKDGFNALTGKLSETFQPHLDALTAGVQGLADQLKVHGSNLLTAAQGHYETLKDKLSGHLTTLQGHASTLGDHAQNALGALKDAVTSIVAQTADNVAGTVGDIVQTGIDASKLVGDHVGDALSGTTN